YADHPFVDHIRKEILEQNSKLVADVSAGHILDNDVLSEFLEDTTHRSRLLASVLWALRFGAPEAESLFRALVPLADGGSAIRTGPRPVDSKGRKDKEKARLKQAIRDLKESERGRDKAVHDAEVSHRLLDKANRELNEVRNKYALAATEFEATITKLRE